MRPGVECLHQARAVIAPEWRNSMSGFSSYSRGPLRKRILASAAVVALVASGDGQRYVAIGPANAAAVVTSDLQSSAAPSFATIVERVKPAVVSVKVDIEDTSAQSGDSSGQMDNLPPQLRQFFDPFGGGNGSTPKHGKSRQLIGQGSGFFISSDGYVVTNNHVVDHAKTVSVTTDDGKTLSAEVIGRDPKTDLALLKVNAKGDYPFVSLAKSEPRIGDWVVAIGNPFGLGGTVTAGIVSAEGRDIGNGPYDQFLQIDAPINKGNSGGPTFNLKGEVVGVNTAIFSPSGGSVGLGFAIPATTVGGVVDALEHAGYVSRGYLGVTIQPVGQEIADALGIKANSGALVDQAQPGAPATLAGVKSGDVITKLNGEPIKDAADLTRHVGALKPGDKVELTFLREGAEKTVSLSLGAQKNEQTAMAAAAQNEGSLKLGVELAPAAQVSGAGDQGVAIVKVDPTAPPPARGLSEGDVILNVSGKDVSQPSQVKSEIAPRSRMARRRC